MGDLWVRTVGLAIDGEGPRVGGEGDGKLLNCYRKVVDAWQGESNWGETVADPGG